MFINFPYTNAHQLNLDWILHAIKHQVKSVNNTFPDHVGNINLPGVAGVSSVDMIGADGAGNVELIINANRIFKNKKILVIGDSISKTTDNWTEFFSDMVQKSPYAEVRGRVSVTIQPPSGAFFTVSSPPWRVMISSQTDRPMPVPRFLELPL